MNPEPSLQGSTGRGRGPSALVARPPSLALIQRFTVHRLSPDAVTLAEAVEPFLVWLQGVRRYAPNTVNAYGRDLSSFVRFAGAVGLTRPAEVTVQYIELYLALLTERGAKPTTSNRALAALRSWFRYLKREGAATDNPATEAFSVKEPGRVPRYLTVAEQEHVLTTLGKDRSLLGRRDHALVATALLCGLRCEELATLRVADVDADRVRVVGKGSKQREIPVVRRLQRLLWTYLRRTRPALLGSDASPFVFVNGHARTRCWRDRHAGEPLRTRSVYRIVRGRVSPVVGRPVSPHTLRHSFASRLRERGASLQSVQEVMGHALLSTTAGYSHLSTSQQAAELTRLLEAPGSTGRRRTAR